MESIRRVLSADDAAWSLLFSYSTLKKGELVYFGLYFLGEKGSSLSQRNVVRNFLEGKKNKYMKHSCLLETVSV